MREVLLVLLIASVAVYLACEKPSPETAAAKPSPTRNVALDEHMFQSTGSLDDVRTEARAAVMQYVTTKLPAWKVKGTASHYYSSGNYWINVDVENSGRTATLSLYAEKYFPEVGEPYWKVVPTAATLPEQLHEMKDLEILKHLRDAEEGQP